jgi:GAF domain-containing protein
VLCCSSCDLPCQGCVCKFRYQWWEFVLVGTYADPGRMLPYPRSRLRKLVSSPAFFGAVQTVLTALAGGAASVGLRLLGLGPWALFTAVCTAVATAAGIFKAVLKVQRDARKDSVHELEGCLETLLSVLNPPGDPEYDSGLRATLHRAEDRGESFVQIVNYVGDDRLPNTAGRKFRATAGLAGRVLKNGSAYSASRAAANHEAYVRELMDEWGYTEAEARARDMSAMSWMAVPLEANGKVEGLLYLDSTRPDFFEDPRRQRELMGAAVGIAKFVARRYT